MTDTEKIQLAEDWYDDPSTTQKETVRNNALKIDTISETTDDGYYIKQTFSNGRIQKDKISFSYETFITNNKAAMTVNGSVECIKRE